jgi:fumarate hydratase class I
MKPNRRRSAWRRAVSLWAGRHKGAREGEGWKVTAAGPTTSIREEPHPAEIIRRYGVRAVIGKGGMGAKTLAGLKESGAVYLNAVGGAAQFYARCIERVAGVSLLEFGTPEAMWQLDVRDFPAIVTMDSHGNSLHKEIEEKSGTVLGSFGVTKQNSESRSQNSECLSF